MAEICTELSDVDWLVFDGADAGLVKREAAGLPLSQSASKAVLQARLSETQACVVSDMRSRHWNQGFRP
jgi:hypothetical protein